jgi:hypothetical protein
MVWGGHERPVARLWAPQDPVVATKSTGKRLDDHKNNEKNKVSRVLRKCLRGKTRGQSKLARGGGGGVSQGKDMVVVSLEGVQSFQLFRDVVPW